MTIHDNTGLRDCNIRLEIEGDQKFLETQRFQGPPNHSKDAQLPFPQRSRNARDLGLETAFVHGAHASQVHASKSSMIANLNQGKFLHFYRVFANVRWCLTRQKGKFLPSNSWLNEMDVFSGKIIHKWRVFALWYFSSWPKTASIFPPIVLGLSLQVVEGKIIWVSHDFPRKDLWSGGMKELVSCFATQETRDIFYQQYRIPIYS